MGVARHRLEMMIHGARIATDKIVREIIDRFEDKPVVRPEPALASADESRVRVDANKETVVDKKRDYPVYLHWLVPSDCPSKPQSNRTPTPLALHDTAVCGALRSTKPMCSSISR